jgi:hypothetical protein
MDQQFGSFGIGKKPGVIVIDQIENNHISAHSIVKRLV